MNAVTEPTNFTLPKKPRVREKDAPPDQRKVAVLPIRVINDKNITDGAVRVLASLCSYCNRAGLTWVSQKRLAQDMGVTRQAITNQLAQLRKHGYVEIIRKGFRGERSNTLRVIFDPSLKAEDPIALTSAQENTRPPSMKDDLPDPVGQRKVAQLIAQALKPVVTKKEYSMPTKNQTRTVKQMKAEIAKKKTKGSPKGSPIGHSPMSNVDESIGHSTVSSQDSQEFPITRQEHIETVYKEYLSKDLLNELKSLGVDKSEVIDNLPDLIDAYKAEGLTPTPKQLMDSLLAMHRTNR